MLEKKKSLKIFGNAVTHSLGVLWDSEAYPVPNPEYAQCKTTRFPPLLLGGFSSGRELMISHICLKSRGLSSPNFCFLKGLDNTFKGETVQEPLTVFQVLRINVFSRSLSFTS